jgi:hypothetical protein
VERGKLALVYLRKKSNIPEETGMPMRPYLPIAVALLSIAAPALAMQDSAADAPAEKKDDTLKKAGDIASQPAKDVGITKTKIPAVLLDAQSQPYIAATPNSCTGISRAITELNEVLGPDFDANAKGNEDKFGKLAEAGGSAVVNSLIPFRGLVREVSGAAPAERRLNAAINAGVARRGYLRGLAVSRKCKLPG